MTAPFTFAQLPQRAMLQPSIHARGARGYVYPGNMDDYHAPGALHARGETRCAVDAAFLVQQVLGLARHSPGMWPGVPGARERAIALATKIGAYGDYQREGCAFLAERDYGLLADQPGLGKTFQAIVAAEARLSLGHVPTPTTPVVLVLAPAMAKHVWAEQITRWTGHSSTILEGLTADELPQTRYVIANYDILHGMRKKDAAGVVHDVAHLTGWAKTLAEKFLIVICDEVHMLRGRSSQRYKYTKAVCKKVPVVWGLSGTPIPNYVRDLWAQLDVLSDGLFGTYWQFARAHCDLTQAQYGMKDTGSSRMQELSARLTFFCLGRTAEQVKLELPEKRREIYKVDVTVSAETVAEGNEAQLRKTFVAKALRATAKAKRSAVVEQAVEALLAKQKVIVFVYMREQADAVAKAIKGKFDGQVACVHGDMTPEGRGVQAQVFREAQGAACFVATIDSVTMAISLVGAELVIFGDLVPEPWKLLQAEKRAHRIGGTTRVLVRYLIGIGTLDEAVAESVIAKLSVIEQAIGGDGDQGELQTMFGGRTDESIVDGLFERLKQLSGGEG